MNNDFKTGYFDALIMHLCEEGIIDSSDAKRVIADYHENGVDLSSLDPENQKKVLKAFKENLKRITKTSTNFD